jgi:hypothetical protein
MRYGDHECQHSLCCKGFAPKLSTAESSRSVDALPGRSASRSLAEWTLASGVWIEELGDVSLRPIDESEALSMFDELEGLKVLKDSVAGCQSTCDASHN